MRPLSWQKTRNKSGLEDKTLGRATRHGVWPDFLIYPLCISLRAIYTESRPRSEHIDRKTATFGTFLTISLSKDTLKFQADSKAHFCVKSSTYI